MILTPAQIRQLNHWRISLFARGLEYQQTPGRYPRALETLRHVESKLFPIWGKPRIDGVLVGDATP